MTLQRVDPVEGSESKTMSLSEASCLLQHFSCFYMILIYQIMTGRDISLSLSAVYKYNIARGMIISY